MHKPYPTPDQLASYHDQLVADYHRACDAGEDVEEIYEKLAVVEVAWCNHPDRPLPTDEELAEDGWEVA